MLGRKLLASFYVLYLGVATVLGAKFLVLSGSDASIFLRSEGRTRGVPNAPLRIVEYFDYECGSCRIAHETLQEFFAQHPGDIYLEARFHPLLNHRHGLRSALYAFCADRQNRFWKWHDLLFEHQHEWSSLQDAEATFRGYARAVDLDDAKLTACLGDPTTEKAVLDQKASGTSLGVRMTPSFFINNKLIVGSKDLQKELNAHFSNEKKGDVYDGTATYA